MRNVYFVIGIIGVFASLSVQADVVQLNNGDQISGEIITMGGKSLTVDTKYAGKLS